MDHKKILYLCNLNLSKGGAQRVTFKTLGCLSKVFDIVVYMPEKPSPESLSLLSDLGIEYVLDEELNLERLKATVASRKIDLVLIQREHPLWITTVYRVKKATGVEYVVFVHELPFIGTPPEKSRKFRNWYLLIFLRYLRLFYAIALDRLHKGYEGNFIAQPPGAGRETRVRRTISPKKVLRVIATIRYTKSGLKSAKRVIAVGPASKFYIDNYLGLRNTTVLKHTAAPDITLNNDLDHRNFVYDICFMAARLERGKGIFDVLEVVHRLKTTLNRDVRAVMLGRFLDNRTQKMFLSKMRELGLETSVLLPGYVSEEEKLNVLCSSKVFLYPSTKDAFSISLADALACGLPAVVFDMPFVRQFDQVGVYKVKYRDIDAMTIRVAEMLNLFINERTKYDELAKAIRTSLASSFSWDVTCNEQVQALLEALSDTR